MFIGNMKYFKIQFGYNEADYLEIDGAELSKAIALFMEGGRGLFKNGAIRGQDIIRIVPDWHTDQGWNKGWKMQVEDYEAIAPLQEAYNQTYHLAKEVAEFALKTNRRELLAQPLESAIAQLPIKNTEVIAPIKVLAEKFRITENNGLK